MIIKKQKTTSPKKLVPLLFLLCLFTFQQGCSKTPEKKALITFQFDDTFITQYTIAKPLFDSKNIKATLMVRTSNAGKSEYFMSWAQLKEMHDDGWEIASHTVNHINLKNADESAIRYELSRSKAELKEHGFQNVTNFAYPYNWYDLKTLYIVPEYYRSARTSVAQTDFHINPEKIRPYELSGYEARLSIGNVADTFKYVDKAQKEGRWLIFILHELSDNTSASKTSTVEVSDIKPLEMLIDYIQERDIPIVTTEQALDSFVGSESP